MAKQDPLRRIDEAHSTETRLKGPIAENRGASPTTVGAPPYAGAFEVHESAVGDQHTAFGVPIPRHQQTAILGPSHPCKPLEIVVKRCKGGSKKQPGEVNEEAVPYGVLRPGIHVGLSAFVHKAAVLDSDEIIKSDLAHYCRSPSNMGIAPKMKALKNRSLKRLVYIENSETVFSIRVLLTA